MKKLDTIGWYVANLHQILGHNKAAASLGEPTGDCSLCILCLYEAGKATKQDVIDRIGV